MSDKTVATDGIETVKVNFQIESETYSAMLTVKDADYLLRRIEKRQYPESEETREYREDKLKRWSKEGVTEQVRSHLTHAVRAFTGGKMSEATLYQRLFSVQRVLINQLWWHGHDLDNILESCIPRSEQANIIRDGYHHHRDLVDLCSQTIFSYLPGNEPRTVPTFETWTEIVASIEKNLDPLPA